MPSLLTLAGSNSLKALSEQLQTLFAWVGDSAESNQAITERLAFGADALRVARSRLAAVQLVDFVSWPSVLSPALVALSVDALRDALVQQPERFNAREAHRTFAQMLLFLAAASGLSIISDAPSCWLIVELLFAHALSRAWERSTDNELRHGANAIDRALQRLLRSSQMSESLVSEVATLLLALAHNDATPFESVAAVLALRSLSRVSSETLFHPESIVALHKQGTLESPTCISSKMLGALTRMARRHRVERVSRQAVGCTIVPLAWFAVRAELRQLVGRAGTPVLG